MILFELGKEHRVRLHNGQATVSGASAAKMKKIVLRAVKRAGCAPADGEPDYNAAKLLIEEHGGKILAFEPTSVAGRVY